jgi:hypothetical protein
MTMFVIGLPRFDQSPQVSRGLRRGQIHLNRLSCENGDIGSLDKVVGRPGAWDFGSNGPRARTHAGHVIAIGVRGCSCFEQVRVVSALDLSIRQRRIGLIAQVAIDQGGRLVELQVQAADTVRRGIHFRGLVGQNITLLRRDLF